jgi:hypothetical protein
MASRNSPRKKESENAMAMIKTKKAKTTKRQAPGSETPTGECTSKRPKKLRKVNLKDLIDDDDDDAGYPDGDDTGF